eukprot:1420198-Rhodomonas_salina.1
MKGTDPSAAKTMSASTSIVEAPSSTRLSTSDTSLAASWRATRSRVRAALTSSWLGRHTSAGLSVIRTSHADTRAGERPSSDAARLAADTSSLIAPLASASLPRPAACKRKRLLLRASPELFGVTFHSPNTTTPVDSLDPTATPAADVSLRGLIQYAVLPEALSSPWKCSPTAPTYALLVPATPCSHAPASAAVAVWIASASPSPPTSSPFVTRSFTAHGDDSAWSMHTSPVSSRTVPVAG